MVYVKRGLTGEQPKKRGRPAKKDVVSGGVEARLYDEAVAQVEARVIESDHNNAIPSIAKEVPLNHLMNDRFQNASMIEIGGQKMPLVDINAFGQRPPNSINPEKRVAWFVRDELVTGSNGNHMQRKQYAYLIDDIVRRLESILGPGGCSLFVSMDQGTWQIVNSFGAAECGTFFQNPQYIIATAERLARAVNIKYEMEEAEKTYLEKILGKHPGWQESLGDPGRTRGRVNDPTRQVTYHV